MLAPTKWILLASAIPMVVAQTESVFTIQTFETTNPPATFVSSQPPQITDSCIGDFCGTSTQSHCYAVCVRSPCFACSTFTGLPTIPPPSDSGFMSIPQGETGNPTPPSTITTGTSGGAASSTTGASSTQSTGAAAPGYIAGDGSYVLFAVLLSSFSITLGFAWTLI